jgi:hypothetical protein
MRSIMPVSIEMLDSRRVDCRASANKSDDLVALA